MHLPATVRPSWLKSLLIALCQAYRCPLTSSRVEEAWSWISEAPRFSSAGAFSVQGVWNSCYYTSGFFPIEADAVRSERPIGTQTTKAPRKMYVGLE